MKITRIKPGHFPIPVAPFSYAIKAKGKEFLFIPNQIPVDSAGRVIDKGDIVSQTTRVFENIRAILMEVNSSLENIVKITWYLTNREHWKPAVEVRNQYFKDKWPAATFVLIDSLSRDDVLIEISAIAIIYKSSDERVLLKGRGMNKGNSDTREFSQNEKSRSIWFKAQ